MATTSTPEDKPASTTTTSTTTKTPSGAVEEKVDQKTEGVPVTEVDGEKPEPPEGEKSWGGTSAEDSPPPLFVNQAAADALQAQRDAEKEQGEIANEEYKAMQAGSNKSEESTKEPADK